jgi:hypothetical protein
MGPIDYGDGEVDKIILAKHYVVQNLLNYPATADFHDMDTRVEGDDVYLKVSAKNAFGVPDILRFKITIKEGKVVDYGEST